MSPIGVSRPHDEATSLVTSSRFEVIQCIEEVVRKHIGSLLKPVDKSWQPSEFLPDTSTRNIREQLALFQEKARCLSDDLLVVLIGDMITEEALPSYQTWLNRLRGLTDETGMSDRPWAQWSRGWTAEENRHGDLLNRYLYLTGRVNMHSVETTIHHLIRNGFDARTDNDPYLGFIYTSFQERATKISHRNVATLAKKAGEDTLHTICGIIAGDEARHETAYKLFMSKVFEIDPAGALESFALMMKRKITMPAMAMEEGNDDQLFTKFSKVAQKLGVYTVQDYAEIIRELVEHWKVESLVGLSHAAEQAQDYLCNLGQRYQKLAERVVLNETFSFNWIYAKEAV